MANFIDAMDSILSNPPGNPNLFIQETDSYTLRVELLDTNKMTIQLDFFSKYENKCVEYYQDITDEDIPALIKCIYDNVG